MTKWLGIFLFSNIAWAEAAPAGPGSALGPLVPLVIMFVIFYFLVLRPQHKKQKQQQDFLKELKKGDMVITNSGIIGVIKNLSEKLITLEVDEGVCIKLLRNQILESANTLKDPKPTKA